MQSFYSVTKSVKSIKMTHIIILLLSLIVASSLSAENDKNEKKYTFDSFVKFVGTSSNERVNREKFNFRRELESYYVSGKGYDPGFRFESEDGLISMITIYFEKSTRYFTKHLDFPKLNKARPSKKDALKFIKSFGADFIITENRKGNSGNIFATYKNNYEAVFVLTGNKLEWITIRPGDGAPDFTQIEYEKYGPRGILGESYTIKDNVISIIPSTYSSKAINFGDTLFSADIGENRHFEGVYKRGTSRGKYTFTDYLHTYREGYFSKKRHINKNMPTGTFVYEGEFKDWYAEGKGKLTYPNGDVTVGTWRKGYPIKVDSMNRNGCIYTGVVNRILEPDGDGIIICSDRTIKGNFKSHKNFEIIGENYYYYGEIDLNNYQPSGKGTLNSKKYSIKDGKFKDGIPWSGRGAILPEGQKDIKLIGRFEKGEFISEGSKKLDNDIVYQGTTDVNGLYHQKGEFIFPNGGYLNVEHDHGKFISSSGTITKSDGSKHSGHFNEQHNLDGNGYIVFKDEKILNGVFSNGVFQSGNGDVEFKDGLYEGDINKSFIPNGEGKMTLHNGNVIEGQFVNGEFQSGTGVIAYNDGTYKGEINKSFKPHGVGTFKDKDGVTFDGNFVNGSFVGGKSNRKLADGSTIDVEVDANGNANGYGVLIRKDGSSFEGEFVNNNFTGGTGTINYSDGTSYNGDVNANFLPHGQGTNYNGSPFDAEAYIRGTFNNGKLVAGYAERKYSQKITYTGIVDANGNPNGEGVLVKTSEPYNIVLPMRLVVTGYFRGNTAVGDVTLKLRTGSKKYRDGYDYIGPVDSNFEPHGYGKFKQYKSSKWENLTFEHGKIK